MNVSLLSTGQFRPVAILVQHLGIGEGMGVVDRPVVYHFTHRQFDDLAGLGAGDGIHLQDAGGHVAGGAVLFYLLADPFAQRLIQLATRLELDEQHHSLVLFPLLADDDALLTSSSCST